MSSRALRKAQREREEQEQLQKLQLQEAEEEEDEDEDDAPVSAPAAKSLFAMLGDEDEGDLDDEDDAEDETPLEPSNQSQREQEKSQSTPPKSSSQRKKKKKAKKSKKAADKTLVDSALSDPSLDEIDLALKSLSTKPNSEHRLTPSANVSDPAIIELCGLLSIDTAHLHASNEMRRLFGRAALERDDDADDAAAGQGRRRNRGGAQVGLAAALRGRQGAGGRTSGLAALSLRRNIFIQGKDEWPAATSGGLGMEIVEKADDGTVEYRYTHTRPYQDVQAQFEACVASMDPNRMVQLLQFNPYHISTLLQVSEIAKQERDHATSGDLLERALFSFGRSVHSTFASNLAQGKARMDFRRPENREFWLAACRYIANLGMRATWRTVYEWAKLLLSLDPEGDPYCISLVLDQYAVRAKASQNFLELINSSFFSDRWRQLANIQLTKGLALVQSGEEGKGKQALFTAVTKHPFVVARLFQELNLDPPPAVWGKQPRTDSEKLYTELYATRAKDIWNTPEASNLLAEVSAALITQVPDPPVVDDEITLDEARHVLMSDAPALIALLPRSITSKVTSSSDPLPPVDDLPSYTPAMSASTTRATSTRAGTGHVASVAENLRELQGLYGFFSDLFPWFNANGEGNDARPQPSEEEIERRIQESGVSEEVVVQRTQRLMELQTSLAAASDRDLAEMGGRNTEAAAAARQAHVEEVEDDEDDQA